MSLTGHEISFARLADLVEGRLAANERRDVEAHVAECRRCARDFAQLEKAVRLMRADASEDAPRDALQYALSLFNSRRDAAEHSPGFAERILAALTFDSARSAPAFGLRSSHATHARQFMYAAGERDVDLRVERVEAGWSVTGQILGECAGGRAEIESASDAPHKFEAALNELCEFRLPPVPAGLYTLLLRLSDAEIQIPEIDLRS